MRIYQKPEFDFVKLNAQDVVCGSPIDYKDDGLWSNDNGGGGN